MTESEWLTDNWPSGMLRFLNGKSSNRKRRLAACAFCRRVRGRLTDKRWEKILKVGEDMAEGFETKAVRRNILRAMDGFGPEDQLADELLTPDKFFHAEDPMRTTFAVAVKGTSAEVIAAERLAQRSLVWDIFGNPFRPVTIDPAWRTWNDGTVVKLAQTIYDERALPSGHLDAGRLAILADALEEAGCSNADILSHCRSPGPHVRGCWVVDLLLGKE